MDLLHRHEHKNENYRDVVLIGAGIMSATLGMFLKQLQPNWKIDIYETLDAVALESSDAWNNAGTGHSALCELNYTPQKADGSVDISKALHITEQFEVTRQFWAWLVEQGIIPNPGDFIHSIPHMSFVWGDENVDYLRKRFETMKQHHFYSAMQFSENPAQLAEWMPLVMEGRDKNENVAANYIDIGTDVNFGALTRIYFNYLKHQENTKLYVHHNVHDLHSEKDGHWRVSVTNSATGGKKELHAGFVFIGAGGGSLQLLEKSHIHESKGFGGFPVSGQWLRCTNKEVIARHHAKVYGKAAVGSPPMSVPHLDTRIIDGEQELLFGPFAGFSTKFLKEGSGLDLFTSIRLSNVVPMVAAGLHNIPLTMYLIDQVRLSQDDRIEELRAYLPEARSEDWELKIAGQRVQVIKKDDKEGGVLEFGTEVVSSEDGSIAALLGASPGASTAVSIMLGLIKTCFKDKIDTEEWQSKLKQMIPSYGHELAKDAAMTAAVREHTGKVLSIK